MNETTTKAAAARFFAATTAMWAGNAALQILRSPAAFSAGDCVIVLAAAASIIGAAWFSIGKS